MPDSKAHVLFESLQVPGKSIDRLSDSKFLKSGWSMYSFLGMGG